MAAVKEIPFQIVEENWLWGLDNTQISETLLCDWGGATPAKGHSSYIGMVIIAIWACPWNPCSGTGQPGGGYGGRRRVVY